MCYGKAVSNSPTDGTTGDQCPIGSYCVSGSAKATICADGTKTTAVAQSGCSNCIAGKWCSGSVEFPCPTRRYCLAGSVRGKICEAGTYNDVTTGLSSASQCSSCPARYYCIDGIKGSDFCESGHICLGGATTPLPTGVFGTDNNYKCPIGRYCLKAGATNINAPTLCSTSKYTYTLASDALDDCLPCEAGFYCPTSSFVPNACPAGSYCIKGSIIYTQCPIYTFRSSTNAPYERACAQCTGGYYCNVVGLDSLSGKQCSVGKFCPIGTKTEINCPSGYYRSSLGASAASHCAV